MIQPRRAEIVSDDLKRIIERFRDAAKICGTGSWQRPCVDQWRNTHENQSGGGTRLRRRAHYVTRQKSVPRVQIGNKVDAGLMQMLAKFFEVSKDECLVFPYRCAERSPKLITL